MSSNHVSKGKKHKKIKKQKIKNNNNSIYNSIKRKFNKINVAKRFSRISGAKISKNKYN